MDVETSREAILGVDASISFLVSLLVVLLVAMIQASNLLSATISVTNLEIITMHALKIVTVILIPIIVADNEVLFFISTTTISSLIPPLKRPSEKSEKSIPSCSVNTGVHAQTCAEYSISVAKR